jgi:HAD superfamily hydrolase (TIGR01509 family)
MDNQTIKLHIFDCDGTLLDSMRMWENISSDYIESLGITPPPNLAEILDPMTYPEATQYLSDHFDIGTYQETFDGIMERVLWHYKNDLELFPGIEEELEEVAKEGKPMIILTNSPRNMIEAGLQRTGILHYFQRLFITSEMGLSKDHPEIFRVVCQEMQVDPSEALVYEDSSFAIDAAKAAGCIVKEYDRYR